MAHAIGTLVAAVITVKFAPSYKLVGAFIVGLAFFIGGVMAANMIPAPTWFIVLDLVGAYLPFAWLGHILGRPREQANSHVG